MRTLNLNELEDKINQYSNDIVFSEFNFSTEKINHFFEFLLDQAISKNILIRIENDFCSLLDELKKLNINDRRDIIQAKKLIKLREEKGVLAYYTIKLYFEKTEKFESHYFEFIDDWYHVNSSLFRDYYSVFIDNFFKPFVELIEWYIYEGKTKNETDYFSKNEIEQINLKLDLILQKTDIGNEVIFNEVDELKTLTYALNKKNFKEVILGKFKDTALSSVISFENLDLLFDSFVSTLK